jgi:hypothetical protein
MILPGFPIWRRTEPSSLGALEIVGYFRLADVHQNQEGHEMGSGRDTPGPPSCRRRQPAPRWKPSRHARRRGAFTHGRPSPLGHHSCNARSRQMCELSVAKVGWENLNQLKQ